MTVESSYTEYDTWAWLYDLTMGSTYGTTQLKTIEKILLPILSKPCHILDLCCGTGQLAVSLSLKGYKVTGIDNSVQMLQYARKNSRHQGSITNFVLGDARNFSTNNPVDAVISTSASLNHIMSLEDLKKVFLRVNESLVGGGVFFFDVNHHGQMQKWWSGNLAEGEIKPNYAWGIVPSYNSESKTGTFKVLTHHNTSIHDTSLSQNLKNILYKILGLQRLTGLRFRIIENFQAWQPSWNYGEVDYPVRGHSIEEIQLLLAEAGFSEASVLTVDGTELNSDRSAYFLAYNTN
ncbi:MAG: class I SAM-dependent methyltransferase [Cyanobacteria bacterium P01_G01_bin.67]